VNEPSCSAETLMKSPWSNSFTFAMEAVGDVVVLAAGAGVMELPQVFEAGESSQSARLPGCRLFARRCIKGGKEAAGRILGTPVVAAAGRR